MSVLCPLSPPNMHSSPVGQLAPSPLGHLHEYSAPFVPELESINLLLEQGSFFTPSSPSSSSLGRCG